MLSSFLSAAAAAALSTASAGPADSVPTPTIDPRLVLAAPIDTARRRPHAIEYSDWYGRRLTVHRYASYVMLPVFAGEYVYGQRLLREKTDAFAGRGNGVSDTDRGVHQFFAGSVAALFGINTVTGLWNLYDSRHDPAGRRLRVTHSLLLLASDAGFVATGLIAGRASEGSPAAGRTHRNVALASMGVATVGTGMMWLLHH
ncbi:MAG: hypothetical protein JO180_09350 [Gemmatirosa sp.]|nr:hypothetical protein [Gemmatirosa sp.]